MTRAQTTRPVRMREGDWRVAKVCAAQEGVTLQTWVGWAVRRQAAVSAAARGTEEEAAEGEERAVAVGGRG